ncbi:YybH family protein [Pseudonocardia spinosispora]|uniref:YybH family protein n=1 Tax=Pseudonocardia spinosispora TaxID=103441 RepID=UPI0004005088|nr:nuclear transport factor 2 family protein [Pseudonocardia spinosispora]
MTDAILDTDRRFFDALLAADSAALDQVLAPEFLIVDVQAGGVTHRPEFLEFVVSGAVRFSRIESFPADAVVRVFGDTAVVVGRTAMELTMPDGTQVSAASRYTHVFVAERGHCWRLVSAQGTGIS